MKKQILSIIIGTIVLAFLFGALRAQTVTLTFTGKDANNNWVRLDRVTVTNLTKGWQETLVYPDTTLTMQNSTGIGESFADGGFGLSQNNPNPFTGTTDVKLTVAEAGAVTLEIVDGNGKIVETRHGTSLQLSPQPKSHIRGTTTNPFNFGDQMEYVGYATINGTEYESARISQAQGASQTFALHFAATTYGQPCPGTPTVTDHEGNIYNTVQIGNQCWTKENLRTTTSPSTGTYFISGSGSGTWTGKQAFWYNNDSATYAPMNYGLLYNWNAAVDTFNVAYGETSINADYHNAVSVSFTGHRRGICPAGWHLPGDPDWGELVDYVDSQSEYVCDGNTANIAKALAANVGWDNSTATCTIGNDLSANNATGFSAVPAGVYDGSSFNYVGMVAIFRSTYQPMGDPSVTESMRLRHYDACVNIGNYYSKLEGYSVRCVRD